MYSGQIIDLRQNQRLILCHAPVPKQKVRLVSAAALQLTCHIQTCARSKFRAWTTMSAMIWKKQMRVISTIMIAIMGTEALMNLGKNIRLFWKTGENDLTIMRSSQINNCNWEFSNRFDCIFSFQANFLEQCLQIRNYRNTMISKRNSFVNQPRSLGVLSF